MTSIPSARKLTAQIANYYHRHPAAGHPQGQADAYASHRLVHSANNTGVGQQNNLAEHSLGRNGLGRHDLGMIARAYDMCKTAHQHQKRASGEAYYTHPVAVASILADMHLDPASIVTALLHDVIEDTDVTLDTIARDFSDEIASLVDGVTKLTKMEMQTDNRQAENFRKLVMAMSNDIRVLLVKLADRTHNMRTIAYLDPAKQERIALETLSIYAPLAERIGLATLQHELEDRSFAILHPKVRESISTRLEYLTDEARGLIENITRALKKHLRAAGIDCIITGRTKTLYSIWRKTQRKKIDMEELSDIMAFRVIVGDVKDCYQVLGALHCQFPTVMGRIKDYISTPKPNKYQSLHTTIIGPYKKRIEIQIRTTAMHEVAESGVAAHWQYKTTHGNGSSKGAGKSKTNFSSKANANGLASKAEARHFNWLHDLMDILGRAESAEKFLEHTQMEMYSDQVFCFTPKGMLIALPKNATAVDFAYAVHSDIGNTCSGVRINGKHRQLATILSNGDQVEIITDKDATPNAEWLNFVATGRARSALRRFIRLKKQKEFARLGKVLLDKTARRYGKRKWGKNNEDDSKLVPCLVHFGAESTEDLYSMLGEGTLMPDDVLAKIYSDLRPVKKPAKKPSAKQNQHTLALDIKGLVPGMAVHYGACCHPLPGGRIVGIVTTGKGITVHRRDCSVLEKFSEMPELWLDVEWKKEGPARVSGRIIATLANEPGSLASVTTLISQYDGNISNITLLERAVDFFRFRFDIEVSHLRHLNAILAAMRSNQYVESVSRETL